MEKQELYLKYNFGSQKRDVQSNWTLIRVFSLAATKKGIELVRELQENGFLPDLMICKLCRKKMCLQTRNKTHDGCVWRCSNRIPAEGQKSKYCHSERSVRSNSWFRNASLTLMEILTITYMWFYKLKHEQIMHELKIGTECIADWSSYCREVAVEYIIKNSEKVGGNGVIVEINDSKYEKRRDVNGQRISGTWFFSGAERNSKKCFLVPVSERTASTAIKLMQDWIYPGTIVYTNCWKGYLNLPEYRDFFRFCAIYGVTFKDLETQSAASAEGVWSSVKYSIPFQVNRDDKLLGYWATHMLQQKVRDSPDPFAEFMKSAALLYTDVSSSAVGDDVNTPEPDNAKKNTEFLYPKITL